MKPLMNGTKVKVKSEHCFDSTPWRELCIGIVIGHVINTDLKLVDNIIQFEDTNTTEPFTTCELIRLDYETNESH